MVPLDVSLIAFADSILKREVVFTFLGYYFREVLQPRCQQRADDKPVQVEIPKYVANQVLNVDGELGVVIGVTLSKLVQVLHDHTEPTSRCRRIITKKPGNTAKRVRDVKHVFEVGGQSGEVPSSLCV